MLQWSFKMKIFILFLIFTIPIFATTLNNSLLKIHATLVPKIYMMDHAYKEKIDDNSIIIALLYNKVNYKDALSLKEKIDIKYVNGIKSYKIKVALISYSKINNFKANIYYLFPTNISNIKKVVKKANANRALTFSYLKNDLKYGVMISLNIENRVKPILNLDAIKLHNISFRPVLLNISTIYSTNSNNSLLKNDIKNPYDKAMYFTILTYMSNSQNRVII